jgi:LCP family protein required for cell wall assembly
MNFKTKKIRKGAPKVKRAKELKEIKEIKVKKPNLSSKDKKWIKLIVVAIVLIPLTLFAFKGFFSVAKDTIGKTIIKTVGSKVLKDSQGYTNILALGVGGEGHEAEELTDTILIVSINQKTDNVIMTSLPRDLYIRHELIGGSRINTAFQTAKYKEQDEDAGFSTIMDITEGVTGIEMHYYAMIDFNGLESIVDAVGGVEIDVEETIYDPYYPDNNYGFETFSLGKGLQELDGETALKYVRSRKTTSDFDRSRRQQKLIFAIKEKALKLKILTSKSKMTNLLNAINDHHKTNMTFREMITMSEVAIDLDKSNFVSLVIHDDPNTKGGFLYTPPRSQFNDAFVLLSADGNYSQIHTFINMHRENTSAMIEPPNIKVLNGTRTTGLAGGTKQTLKRFGFNVTEFANAEDRDQLTTKIFYTQYADEDAIDALAQIIPGELIYREAPTSTEPVFDPVSMENKLPEDIDPITIELGEDYIQIYESLEVYSTLVPLIEQAQRETVEARMIQECNSQNEEEKTEECLEFETEKEKQIEEALQNQETEAEETPTEIEAEQPIEFKNTLLDLS